MYIEQLLVLVHEFSFAVYVQQTVTFDVQYAENI